MTEIKKPGSLVVYFLLGAFLGVVFLKSEVVSWFRIQEMFRFQSIHMYGIIGLAVAVGAISVAAMKKFGTRTVRGDEITWPDAASKRPQKHHILGGTIFGLGWGLAGACPGPLFALIGSGLPIIGVALLGALAGAWSYGLMKPKLPH
ncbi:MAG: DUF6691 family protein [Longimicrobiales bacterium]